MQSMTHSGVPQSRPFNPGLECGVNGSGFTVYGLEFRVNGLGFRNQGSGFRV
jgi:hypothetical protein